MVPVSGVNTIATAMTAAATTFGWKSTKPSNIASGDLAAIGQDDGTYLFVSLQGTAATGVTFYISAGMQTTIASGNSIYYFATAGNAGHYKRVLPTGQTQYTDADANVGRFFGSVLGGPMITYMGAFATASGLGGQGSWDYLTLGFMNV
jgi:hypothetical protein